MTDVANLAEKYRLPPELIDYIDRRILEFLYEDEPRKTISFGVPAYCITDRHGETKTVSILWIHPDYNAEFCHLCDKVPGDLANFYVIEDTDCHGDEYLDIPTLDDLDDFLSQVSENAVIPSQSRGS